MKVGGGGEGGLERVRAPRVCVDGVGVGERGGWVSRERGVGVDKYPLSHWGLVGGLGGCGVRLGEGGGGGGKCVGECVGHGE